MSGSGTYGGTATLWATLVADGSGLANEPIVFTFTIGMTVTTLSTATTDANGVATLTGVSLAGTGAGTYVGYVGASFAGDTTNQASAGSGILSVAQAPLTVTANAASKTYASADPAFSASYAGFVAGDGPSDLGGTLEFTTNEPATGYAPVGTYTITPSGLTSSNYSLSFVAGVLTVNPQALTISANPASKTYGDADPAFSVSYAGFVAGEGPGNLGGTLAFATNEPASSYAPVGTYTVTPSGLTSSDYSISFVSGILTVTPQSLTVTANPASKTYGSPDPAFSVSYAGFASGEGPGSLGSTLAFTTNEPASGYASVGTYTITPSGLTSSNYDISFVAGVLTVNPQALAITANPASKTYGQSDPAFSVSYAGFVADEGPSNLGGTLKFSTNEPASGYAPAGTYTIQPSGATSANYQITFVNGTLTINPVATDTVVAPGSASINYGQSQTFTATVSSTAGAPPDGEVQFLVNGAPFGASIAISGGMAQIAISESVGSYTVTAQYQGDSNYAATLTAAEAPATLTVNPIATPATNLAISPNTGNAPGLTDTGAVTFTGTLSATGMSVDVFDTSTNTDLGNATVTGTSFSLALNLAQGSHILRARATLDGAYADAFFTVLVDETSPTSHANSLSTPQATDSFPVTVTFTDPTGSGGAPASGVVSVALYVSVNGGAFSLYQTQTITPAASGTVTFTFNGQDRNTYAFHSISTDAAGNTESKNPNLVEASTYVPDLNPPVTHVISSSPTYSWSPFPSSDFSGIAASSYNSSTGVFTLDWAGADPDQNSGSPPGYIADVNVYVQIDGGSPTLVGQLSAGTPNSSGVYSGSITYDALADDQSHTYNFYSVGVDDEQKVQYAPQSGPSSPDVTFTETYSAPLAVESFAVEKGIAERSYIRYLDVYFNNTAATSPALQALASGLTGSSPNSYLELEWYGENVTASTSPLGSVTLFNSGGSAPTIALNGNDLSFDFGSSGITSFLNGASGTRGPTTKVGDGWYALGIDPTGNPSNEQTFWLPFFRLLGDANGTGVVTGPYATAGTDAYVVYHAEGESGSLLNADVNGDGVVNSKDYQETVLENGQSVGNGPTSANFPQFQLLAGQGTARAGGPPVTQNQVESLLPQAIAAWAVAGLSSADVQLLESVQIRVANLGTTALGLEAGGSITINQTAAGYNWYVGAGSPPAGRVNLLTVMEHELGHAIGLPDNDDARDIMDVTLAPGVRARLTRLTWRRSCWIKAPSS